MLRDTTDLTDLRDSEGWRVGPSFLCGRSGSGPFRVPNRSPGNSDLLSANSGVWSESVARTACTPPYNRFTIRN